MVFTDPYSDAWTYGGEKAIPNLGAVNAFPAAGGSADVSVPGTSVRVAGYGVSALALIAGVAELSRTWWRGRLPRPVGLRDA